MWYGAFLTTGRDIQGGDSGVAHASITYAGKDDDETSFASDRRD